MSQDKDLLAIFQTVAARVDRKDFSKVTRASKITDLGIDSLSMMQIVGEMETELDVTLPDEELVSIQTVGELCDKVQRRLAG
jgi:acyl carrier protein